MFTIIEKKLKLEDSQKKFEKLLNNSCDVICSYSDGQDSPAENSKLRAENERLQKQLDTIKLKIDQFKHESCHEQRLITGNWYHRVSH